MGEKSYRVGWKGRLWGKEIAPEEISGAIVLSIINYWANMQFIKV